MRMKHPLSAAVPAPRPDDIGEKVEQRRGRLHARQRLGIETDHEAQVFGQGLNFFHVENFPFSPVLIRGALRLSGLYWRGRRNASELRVKQNEVVLRRLPRPFDGFKILHLSDLHVDMSEEAMDCLFGLLPGLEYDLCVLTGDYRGKTSGPVDLVLAQMTRLREALKGQAFGILGNHDTVRMVPALEGMGIRMLLNESVALERSGQRIHLAGI